jgi:hypothetical protein
VRAEPKTATARPTWAIASKPCASSSRIRATRCSSVISETTLGSSAASSSSSKSCGWRRLVMPPRRA